MEGDIAGAADIHRRGYVMSNKDDQILMVGLSPDISATQSEIFRSDPLEITQTGTSHPFSIETRNISRIAARRGRSTTGRDH
jgi:hypothetical protein